MKWNEPQRTLTNNKLLLLFFLFWFRRVLGRRRRCGSIQLIDRSIDLSFIDTPLIRMQCYVTIKSVK